MLAALLKSFIVLYVVRGLGRSPSLASAVIAVVAVAYIAGAPLAGRLAERHGIVPVVRVAVTGIPVLASLLFRRRLGYERDAAPDADAVATSRG